MKKRRLKKWVYDAIAILVLGTVFALNVIAIYINYFK